MSKGSKQRPCNIEKFNKNWSSIFKPMRNRCKCLYCFDIIESFSRHDYVSCKCGAIFTDGGLDYTRRGFGDPTNIEFVKTEDIIDYPIEDLSDT